MKRMTSIFAITIGISASSGHAVVLYELVSITNGTTVQNQNTDVLSASGYVRGPGLANNAGGTFNSTSFTVGAGSAAAAIAAGDFITWSFSLDTDYNLDSFSIRYDRSGTGPTQLQIELDTGSGFVVVHTDASVAEPGENNLNISLASFDGVTGGIFRLAAFGASASAGTFDFENTTSINNSSFQLNGTAGSGGPGGGGPGGGPVDPVLTPITADGIIGPGNQAPLISAGQLPAPGAFAAASDGFQIYQRGINSAPFSLLDDTQSIFPADTQGIVRGSDTGAFFGVTDLVNPDNSSGTGIAEFKFDISQLANIAIAIDMAAMGDFESGADNFDFSYSIDGGTFENLFLSSVNEAISQLYTLESGGQFSLNDPLLVNGIMLNNLFQTLSGNVLGEGSVLTLRFSSGTDGGVEAFAFRNIEVTGDPRVGGNPGAIPEPSSTLLALAGLAMMGLARRSRGA